MSRELSTKKLKEKRSWLIFSPFLLKKEKKNKENKERTLLLRLGYLYTVLS